MTYSQFACTYLSGEVRERYIANLVREYGEEKLNYNSQIVDPLDYIWAAFLWFDTPEGSKYWADVVSKMQIDINHFAPEPKAKMPTPEKRSWVFWGVYDKDLDDPKPYDLFWVRREARKDAKRNGLSSKKYIVTEA